MARHAPLLASLTAVLLLLAAPAWTGEEDLEEAVKVLSAALGDSESDELSIGLLKDFLALHSDTKYTASVLDAIAYYQGESMGDRAGAIAFVKEHILTLKERDHIVGSKVVLAGMYDRPENKKELRGVVDELKGDTELSFRHYTTLITSAFGVEDWELALDLAAPAESTAGPNAVLRDYPEAPEETVAERSRARMLDLGVYRGWSLANTGHMDESLALFESAEKESDLDYFGIPKGMLYVYWGKTLLMNEDTDGALGKLLPAALWGADETALDAVKELYGGKGGDPEGFDGYLFEQRAKHARMMDDFSAADYEGKVHGSGDLMGKVTLVAFWFPT